MSARRSPVEIMHDILEIADARDGERKTRIMVDAKLSYTMLQRYLAYLADKGYLRREHRTGAYHVTVEGRRFQRDLTTVLVHLREFRVAAAAPARDAVERPARRRAYI